MRNNRAFKFLGELSNVTMRYSSYYSTGNIVCACIDSGVALIDMTSSIISYTNECKRTNIVENQLFESKIILDELAKVNKHNAKAEIENENVLILKSLEKVKLELSKEYELISLNVENEINQVNQSIEFEKKRSEIVENVRIMIRDTLKISTDTLKVLNLNCGKNKIQIASLEEQIRISTAQYTKMVKIFN